MIGLPEHGKTCLSILEDCEYDTNIKDKCRKTCDTCPSTLYYNSITIISALFKIFVKYYLRDCLSNLYRLENCEWSQWEVSECLPRCAAGNRNKTRKITKPADIEGLCSGKNFTVEQCDDSTLARKTFL